MIKKELILFAITLFAAGLVGCYGYFDFEEYDDPTVPDTIYLPPVEEKMAAMVGGMNYFNAMVRDAIVAQEPSLVDTEISSIQDAQGNTVTFNTDEDASSLLETTTTEMYEGETTAFFSTYQTATNINDYTVAELDAVFETGDDGYIYATPATNFSVSKAEDVRFVVEGEIAVEESSRYFIAVRGIYNGSFSCSFSYEDSAGFEDDYTFDVIFEECFYSESAISDYDEDTQKWTDVDMIAFGGLVTIDKQKFQFNYSLVVPSQSDEK